MWTAELGTEIRVDGVVYRLDPACRCTGHASTVYRLAPGPSTRLVPSQRVVALKVFEQGPGAGALVGAAQRLEAYSRLPALSACRRSVLTLQSSVDIVKNPTLPLVAIVMPWIDGFTWGEIVSERKPLTLIESLTAAQGLADALRALEERGAAHTNLSRANILLPLAVREPTGPQSAVELIDLEHFHAPGWTRLSPVAVSPGLVSPQHPPKLAWSPLGDRFAAAVLLAEFLAWCDEEVREKATADGLFATDELQEDSPRVDLVGEVLGRTWDEAVTRLFMQAWRSRTPEECPSMREWARTLEALEPPTQIAAARESVKVASSLISFAPPWAGNGSAEEAEQGAPADDEAAGENGAGVEPPPTVELSRSGPRRRASDAPPAPAETAPPGPSRSPGAASSPPPRLAGPKGSRTMRDLRDELDDEESESLGKWLPVTALLVALPILTILAWWFWLRSGEGQPGASPGASPSASATVVVGSPEPGTSATVVAGSPGPAASPTSLAGSPQPSGSPGALAGSPYPGSSPGAVPGLAVLVGSPAPGASPVVLAGSPTPAGMAPTSSPATAPRSSPSVGTPAASPAVTAPRASPSMVTPAASPAVTAPLSSPSVRTPAASPASVAPRSSPSAGTPAASPAVIAPRSSPAVGTPAPSPRQTVASSPLEPSPVLPSAAPSMAPLPSPPATSPGAPATLAIAIVPVPTSLSVDGQPWDARKSLQLPPGPHVVRARRNGYRALARMVRLGDGERKTFQASLERAQGLVSLGSTPSRSDVYVDGRRYGSTPIRLALPAGSHTLRVERAGYHAWQKLVQVADRQRLSFSAALAPRTAAAPPRPAANPYRPSWTPPPHRPLPTDPGAGNKTGVPIPRQY